MLKIPSQSSLHIQPLSAQPDIFPVDTSFGDESSLGLKLQRRPSKMIAHDFQDAHYFATQAVPDGLGYRPRAREGGCVAVFQVAGPVGRTRILGRSEISGNLEQ